MDRQLKTLAAALALSLVAAGAQAQVLSGLGATHVYGPFAHQVVAKPSDAEVMAAWPAAAKAKGVTGSAAMHCLADAAGAMTDCQVMIERSHAGFGQALLSLAPQYRVKPAASADHADVVITATWPAPDTAVDWQQPPKPGDFATTMTPAAWRAGKGHAVMNCLVARMGALHDCMVIYQDPPSKGFGAMALRFQGFLRLKPATLGGMPIASGEDIVFNFRQMLPGETF
jgi:hypothetical protein